MRIFRFSVQIILISLVGSGLFAAVTPAASTADAKLVSIATAAKTVGALRNDPQSRMFNYLKYHFGPAATRLSSVCNTATRTFSGTASDAGVIVGMANNTDTTFMVMQGNAIIGQVKPGWNSDIILNLSALSDTTASPLVSFAFVPTTGAQQSQLLVRVMTGQQLFTHITNVEKRESGNAAVTWHKNGANPLPGAGDVAAVGSDLYLVVENETLTTGTPLPAVAKRVQVMNLSNITDLYTLSLSISNMGLALLQNQVSAQAQLESIYAISIESVHILDEIQGHTVPLLLMPRSVFQAGSTVNTSYATYIQAYALALSKAYAGTAPVYYDLAILYTHEPFAYLRLLKYFDLQESLYAVVDQNAALPSGQIIGSMILTDVYGAFAQDVSSDLSWVACNQSGLDTTNNDHVLFTMVSSKPSLAGASVTPTGLDVQSSHATSGFPMTKISHTALTWSNGITTHVQVHSNIGFPSGGAWYGSGLVLNDPTNVTAGQSYNSTGSFPSQLWNLTVKDWSIYGVKLVPVFYDVNKSAPFMNMQDFNRVSTNAQSALYFYAYRGDGSNEFLGILPALSSETAVATYPSATQYVYMFAYNNNWNMWGFESTGYETFVQAKGSDVTALWNKGAQGTITGFTNSGQWNLYYPGSMYWFVPPTGNGSGGVFNKFSDISTLNTMLSDLWTIKNNNQGSWTATVPVTDTQTGVTVEVKSLGSNEYQIILLDASNNVLDFQLLSVAEGVTQFVVSHMSSQGSKKSSSSSMTLPSTVGYFKLMDTAASGLVVVPTTAPVQAPAATATSSASAVTSSTASAVTSGVVRASARKNDVACKQLQKQNAALTKEVAALKAALDAQG